ncbi:hypothetical protein B0H63DRAFT_17945 [Podospora didyma]|uniref:Uncharacterized protein n=1 Tax=Podospora didyma TaxID=330526 RepID=A0AAE0P511_9PEZI|nr:hypothetical protein B0H63DRAFT_17945 [Podospora didyma]
MLSRRSRPLVLPLSSLRLGPCLLEPGTGGEGPFSLARSERSLQEPRHVLAHLSCSMTSAPRKSISPKNLQCNPHWTAIFETQAT